MSWCKITKVKDESAEVKVVEFFFLGWKRDKDGQCAGIVKRLMLGEDDKLNLKDKKIQQRL